MASIEDPNTPLTAAALGDALCDEPSTSGVRVTRKRALGYAACWRGVNLISGDVARIPLKVYERDGDGNKVEAIDHPAFRLLNSEPNNEITAFPFKQALMGHALLNGNGYAYIERDVYYQPIALWLLDPEYTWPVRRNGTLWYINEVSDLDGRPSMVKLMPEDILHVKGLSYDGLVGYPVLKILRDTFGVALAGRDYGCRFFNNDCRPGVVLECPASMNQIAVDNLRNGWERVHQGYNKSHRVGILRDGVKLHTYGAVAKDAQLIESRAFDAREVAVVLGVPPHKVGDPSRTAYNSLEQENASYHEDTLDRWYCVIEEEASKKLLTEQEKRLRSHSVEFTRQALGRTNATAQGELFTKGITTGFLSRDEVRGFLNLNKIPGGKGGIFLKPLNLGGD